MITQAYSHLAEIQIYAKILEQALQKLAADLANPEPDDPGPVKLIRDMEVWSPLNVTKGTD